MFIAFVIFAVALIIHAKIVINARRRLTPEQLGIVDNNASSQAAKIWVVAIPGAALYVMSIMYPTVAGYLYVLGVPLLLAIMLFAQIRDEVKLAQLDLPRDYIISSRIAAIVLWAGLILAIGSVFVIGMRAG